MTKIINCRSDTYMDYPIQLTRINNELSLYLPVPALIRAVYEKTLSTDPDSPFPFWAKVWPASLALTAFLGSNKKLVKGKNVMEIGAGTGVPSFSIAEAAASVIISDHAPDAVELMEKNITFLGLHNVTARCLDWNQFPDDIEADLVLLSDINYAPDQFAPLLKLIQRFLAKGSTVILATPQRMMGIPFIEQLSCYIINCTEEKVNEQDTEVAISILTLQHSAAEGNDRLE